jgi:phosphatidate cytidylyltransferase
VWSVLTEHTIWLIGGVMVVLAVTTTVSQVLRRRIDSGLDPAVIETFNLRLRAWWLMCSVLAVTFLMGKAWTVVLFGLMSFWALREFITLTPTRMADHRTLFWVFIVICPAQYVLVGLGSDYYGLYSIFIPVYAVLFIPARAAFAGDYRRFLERSAKIQAGLMICVYCLSYAPAILSLELKGSETQTTAIRTTAQLDSSDSETILETETATDVEINGQETVPEEEVATPQLPEAASADARYDRNARLLFFFVLVVQVSDLFAYIWDKVLGKRIIAPLINPSKSWEGFLGAVVSTSLLGTVLWWATPFPPWLAAAISAIVSVMGLCGGMTMSAIKRDRGVEDYGTLIRGHGGVLDRLDSTCFAAPVFFHVTLFLSERGWLLVS